VRRGCRFVPASPFWQTYSKGHAARFYGQVDWICKHAPISIQAVKRENRCPVPRRLAKLSGLRMFTVYQHFGLHKRPSIGDSAMGRGGESVPLLGEKR
jgi:hypothetical protein